MPIRPEHRFFYPIASANNGYYPGRPVYVAPGPYGACHFECRAYLDPYGYELIRRVAVCE